MPGTSPFIGILILNHNGQDWLPHVYRSIHQQSYPHWRIYLVDNGSIDDSVELTVRDYPEVVVIRFSRNLGYCMAYNLAMPYAFSDGCEWVVWANNDIRLEPNCLEEMMRTASLDNKIGVVGPAFLSWETDEPSSYMVGNHPYAISAMQSRETRPIDVEWVEGSFLMVRRGCVQAVGPLDPFLFFYWEEADFCRRARLRGWKVVLAPRALARHYGGGWSASDRQRQKTTHHLQARNYFIYKLANPMKSFSANLFSAMHLLLVNLKQTRFQDPAAIFFYLKVFARILLEIRPIYRKWTRDRQGNHPALTTEECSSSKVWVTKSQGESPPRIGL